MARSFDVSDRVILLLSLISTLREHGSATVSELARQFDADEALIRRLVTFLGTAGIPGETHTYQPEDLFDIDWDAFEEHDIVTLTNLVAVDDTPRFSSTEYAALLAGLHTLAEMLPPDQRQLAETVATKLAQAAPVTAADTTSLNPPPHTQAEASLSAEVHAADGVATAGTTDETKDGSEHTLITVSAEQADPQLRTVAKSIETRHRLAFTYQDLRGNSSVRHVEPLTLTQSGSDWYLRAYCLDRKAERTFLIAAMRDTRDTGEAATRHATEVALQIGPSEASIPAVIHIRNATLHLLGGFDPVVTGESEPGWVRAEVNLSHPGAAIRMVQIAGGEVRIESPQEAREAVYEWASRALAPYDE